MPATDYPDWVTQRLVEPDAISLEVGRRYNFIGQMTRLTDGDAGNYALQSALVDSCETAAGVMAVTFQAGQHRFQARINLDEHRREIAARNRLRRRIMNLLASYRPDRHAYGDCWGMDLSQLARRLRVRQSDVSNELSSLAWAGLVTDIGPHSGSHNLRWRATHICGWCAGSGKAPATPCGFCGGSGKREVPTIDQRIM